MIKKYIRRLIQKLLWNKVGASLLRSIEEVNRRIDETARNFSLRSDSNGEYWLIRNMKKEPTIVDVGFHKGNFCKEVLNIRPNSSILAVDPSKKAEENYLQSDISSKVNFKRVALSDYVGVGDFYEYDNACSSLSKRSEIRDVKKEQVKVKTLDKICEDEGIDDIDLIKIDAEGYDLHVIKGAKSMIENRKIKIVMFEYSNAWVHSGTSLAAAFDYFEDKEYELFRLFNGFINQLKYGVQYEQKSFMCVAVKKCYLESSKFDTKELKLI